MSHCVFVLRAGPLGSASGQHAYVAPTHHHRLFIQNIRFIRFTSSCLTLIPKVLENRAKALLRESKEMAELAAVKAAEAEAAGAKLAAALAEVGQPAQR